MRIPVALLIIETVMFMNINPDVALRSTFRFNKRVRLIYLASKVGTEVSQVLFRLSRWENLEYAEKMDTLINATEVFP